MPKTGVMIESTVTATAQNIASSSPAASRARSPLGMPCALPISATGASHSSPSRKFPRANVNWAASGRWVHTAKVGFERYFLHKVRSGQYEPFYESLALRVPGIDKLKAVKTDWDNQEALILESLTEGPGGGLARCKTGRHHCVARPLASGGGAIARRLQGAGIDRIILASGDRQDVVNAVARGLDLALEDLSPQAKLLLVQREGAAGATMMVGDGVNDAPALASATIGVAMGARGSAASSQTAGVVILVDQIDRVLKAVGVAGRTRRIAAESVAGGLLLSLVGMIAAALGLLPSVAGALVQEAIDVAVILNALRALR